MRKVDRSDERHLSGYTAHTKPGQYGGLMINGKGENGHEDFSLREHFSQNESDFCKTARKSYDVVVTACLIILKHYLKDNITIGSDGGASDWSPGYCLARFGAKIDNINYPKELRHELYILSDNG